MTAAYSPGGWGALFLAAAVATAALSGLICGGLYWLPAAFVLAIVIAAVNAWVLLVEVLR